MSGKGRGAPKKTSLHRQAKRRQSPRPSKTTPNFPAAKQKGGKHTPLKNNIKHPRCARKVVGITSSLVAVIRKKGTKHLPAAKQKGGKQPASNQKTPPPSKKAADSPPRIKKHPPAVKQKGAAQPPPPKTTKKQLLRAAARRRDLFAKFSCDRGEPFRHFSA